MHVAVLVENEEMVEYIASNFKQTLKVGDNVRILIKIDEKYLMESVY